MGGAAERLLQVHITQNRQVNPESIIQLTNVDARSLNLLQRFLLAVELSNANS
jgi:hypothetical protein